ncbi:MAG: uroporphyrinogen decarboxylase [Gammaproteobacteria bacterium]|nr:uroporphyrinogen decarboxylase [Gammaproteobacteria bacterium]
MSHLKNDSLLRALLREPVDVTPIWLMRQAGRYLPEYRDVRRRAGDFLTLCRTPALACEVTLQPVRRFPLDAAILFSDILVIPDAMGLGLSIEEQVGPRFADPVGSEKEIRGLRIPDPERDLGYVLEAIRLAQRELSGEVPLIGFCGSPWTVATYMVEGGSSRDFQKIKRLLFERPELLHHLLGVVAAASGAYLNAQVNAGVDAVMIFDSWAGALSRNAYLQFSLEYIRRILETVTRAAHGRRIPAIVFSRGGGAWIEETARCGCDAIGVDWTQDLGDARRRTGGMVALQGNLDPAVLFAPESSIREETTILLESYGKGCGHVFNLGHGVLPDTDPERVATLVAAVHELSRPYHL